MNTLTRKIVITCLLVSAGVVTPGLSRAADTEQASDAAALMSAGAGQFEAGDFTQALDDWDRALSAYQAGKDSTGQAQALLGKGMANMALGRYPRATADLRQALELAEQTGDELLTLRARAALGGALALTDETAEAQALLERALATARAEGHPALAATAGMDLAKLLAGEGKSDRAIAICRDALDDARAAGNPGLEAKTSVNLARALIDSGRGEEGWVAVTEADPKVRALAPSHDRGFLLVSVGGLYNDVAGLVPDKAAQATTRARRAFEEAAVTARDIGDISTLSYALGYQGELLERQGDFSEALALTQEAELHARQAQAPEILYRWKWQEARLLQAQGDTEGAAAAYRSAIANLERIRQDLATSQRRGVISFRKEYGAVYLEYADLLLRQAAVTGDASDAQEYLLGAREAVEMLKSAEIEDYFQDDCVTALKAKTRGVDRLAADTAAIYPIVLEDRLEILVSLPDGIKRYVTPVGAKTVNAEVNELRQLLEKRTTSQYLRPARQIYDWVLRPAQQDLREAGIRTLVIVPDGPLRTIPLAALHDGKQFVIERYAVSTTPGLTLTDPRPIPREKVQVLVAGLTDAVQGFPPLPAVDEELYVISDLYDGQLLENKDFTIANVDAELTSGRPYSIVHMASHGQFENDVRKTFVLTDDSKLTMDKLEGYMGVTAYRDRPVELLTLSACQTAVGDDRAALGLAGVAIKAGARSAMATLWSVNDKASSILVTEFYRELRDPTISKAEALRQAQLTLMQDKRYGHPVYWSPYLLIGNWL
jgi:CHAT domain-containing protein